MSSLCCGILGCADVGAYGMQCDHGVWLTAAHALGSGFSSVVPGMGRSVEDSLLRWLRAAELTCDRAALLVVQVHHMSLCVITWNDCSIECMGQCLHR
jgi:hypothetical protein